MMKLINLTQHKINKEQVDDLLAHGIEVIDCEPQPHVQANITFNDLPSSELLRKRAFVVAEIANLQGANYALVGGAGYFMRHLEDELLARGIVPLHAFTMREVVEIVKDGETVKTAVFKHKGFIGL